MPHALPQSSEANQLLQSAIHAFEEWRSSRKIRGPIPEKLWLTVQPLFMHYSISHIAKALRLNSTQLKEHCNLSIGIQSSDPFVECVQSFSHVSMSSQRDESKQYTLEFDCKHASTVKIRGLSADDLNQLVGVLTGAMPCCN